VVSPARLQRDLCWSSVFRSTAGRAIGCLVYRKITGDGRTDRGHIARLADPGSAE
jgi:hypothetical protein